MSSRPEPAPLQRNLRVDFDRSSRSMAYTVTGFHGPERRGRCSYSWTEKPRAQLDLPPLRRGPYLVEMGILRSVLPRIPASARLTVDGQEVALERSPMVQRGLWQPAAGFPEGGTRIELITSPPIVPPGRDPESDPPVRGMALDFLSLTPWPATQHVNFVSQLFGEGWRAEGEEGATQLRGGWLSILRPGRECQLILEIEEPHDGLGYPHLRVGGRPVPVAWKGGLGLAELPEGQPGEPLRLELTGPTRVFRHAWAYDPSLFRATADALPVARGWSRCACDTLARPFRRMQPVATTLPIRLKARHVQLRVLSHNNPTFPVFLPLDALPHDSPQITLVYNGQRLALQPHPEGLETVYTGEIEHLAEEPCPLQFESVLPRGAANAGPSFAGLEIGP